MQFPICHTGSNLPKNAQFLNETHSHPADTARDEKIRAHRSGRKSGGASTRPFLLPGKRVATKDFKMLLIIPPAGSALLRPTWYLRSQHIPHRQNSRITSQLA